MSNQIGSRVILNEMFCDNSLNERCHITGMPIFTATPMAETPALLTTSLVVQEAGTTPSTVLDGFFLDEIVQQNRRGRLRRWIERPPVHQLSTAPRTMLIAF